MKRNRVIWIRARDLRPHPIAQRVKLVPAELARIRNGYNPAALGTLHAVDYRGVGPELVDGNHRWTVVMEREPDRALRTEIHDEVTDDAGAASLFLQLNDRAVMDGFSLWNNEIAAGDPVTTGALAIVERHGYKVELSKRDGTISSPKTLTRVYKIDAGDTLDETLTVLSAAWGSQSASVEGKLIEGVAYLLSKLNGEVDRQGLIKKLSSYPGGPKALVGAAKLLKSMRRVPMTKAVAEVALEAYCAGKREENRPKLP